MEEPQRTARIITTEADDGDFLHYFLKYFFKCLGIIALLLLILFNTNPTKKSYVEWANNKIMEESSSGLESGLISLFGNTVINTSTTTNNLYFVTIFTTSIDGHKMKTLGLFNQFIPISSK